MIPLTRLNHQRLILNCELIKCIEQPHETVITLVNGEKLTVTETPEEIVRLITRFRAELAEVVRAAGVEPPLPLILSDTEPCEDFHG